MEWHHCCLANTEYKKRIQQAGPCRVEFAGEDAGEDAGEQCFQAAKKLEYGLKLLRDRSGIDNFSINAEALTNTEKYINDLVKKYYRQEYDAYYIDKQEN